MARGKPWTDVEIGLLTDMVTQGLNPQQICESGKFIGRTFQAVKKQFNLVKRFGTIVATKPAAIVATIEPAANAMSMDRVVKLFTKASRAQGI
jgi:hypothetical protein